MAAQLAAMRQMFVRVGCSDPAATILVDSHGLTDVDMLRRFDDNEVTSLCTMLKNLGDKFQTRTMQEHSSLTQEHQSRSWPNRTSS